MATAKLFCCFSRAKRNQTKGSEISPPSTPVDRVGNGCFQDVAEKQWQTAPPAPLSYLQSEPIVTRNDAINSAPINARPKSRIGEQMCANCDRKSNAFAEDNNKDQINHNDDENEDEDDLGADFEADRADTNTDVNFSSSLRRQSSSPSPKMPVKIDVNAALSVPVTVAYSTSSATTLNSPLNASLPSKLLCSSSSSMRNPLQTASLFTMSTPASANTQDTLNEGPNHFAFNNETIQYSKMENPNSPKINVEETGNQPKEGEQNAVASASNVIATAFVEANAQETAVAHDNVPAAGARHNETRATQPDNVENVPQVIAPTNTGDQNMRVRRVEINTQDSGDKHNTPPTPNRNSAAFASMVTSVAPPNSASLAAAEASAITAYSTIGHNRLLTPSGYQMAPSPHVGYRDFFTIHGFPNSEDSAIQILPPCLVASNGAQNTLLPLPSPTNSGKKCLVLDLDETLVHSSFTAVENADFVIPIHLDSYTQNVFVQKRPGVDEFLARISSHYEIVVFTASLAAYADAVLDLLDPNNYVQHRLFRDSCVMFLGSYVKNLSVLGRDVQNVAIVDNSHFSYAFHVRNAVPILSWFDDPEDIELERLAHVLLEMAEAPNVPDFLLEKRRNGLLPPP